MCVCSWDHRRKRKRPQVGRLEAGFRNRGRRYESGLESSDLGPLDRKSTRLNSSHSQISYAVFCLKKKKHNKTTKSRSNTASNSTKPTSPHLSRGRQIIAPIT